MLRGLMIGTALSLSALVLASPAMASDVMPIEPIDVPPSVEQGLDMVYIDSEMAPSMERRDALLADLGFNKDVGAPVDLFTPVHHLYTDLRRSLVRYRMKWSDLPQIQLSNGPVLKLGSDDERVALLRKRLGLGDGAEFDEALERKVTEYQQVHGLKADGIVAGATISSLNRGADHYEQVLMLNLERARRLPTVGERGRYVLVDAGSARLTMYEDGKAVDSMKVIVGTAETETPMMAALMRYAAVNPYWNVPPELVRSMVAPRVMEQGLTYLYERNYEVLTDWTEEAELIDPTTVDWQKVADGRTDVWLRRGPGPWNSMGEIKFMMPNAYGIYLHDTPDAEEVLFEAENRWISNGCIRLEDARRFAKWVFGEMPKGSNPKVEERVDLDDPVPVYVTYMTAAAGPNGPQFRADPYNRDPALLARMGGDDTPSELALRR